MTYSTTDNEISTFVEIIEEGYFPPVKIIYNKDDRVRYVPVSYEKDLIQYDIRVYQYEYPDGSLGKPCINIKIDSSKNIINNRFEILDL